MSWKITYNNDTEIETVGTAIATFLDENGEVLVTYKDRLDTSVKGAKDTFVAKAKSVLEKVQSEKTKSDNLEEELTILINQ